MFCNSRYGVHTTEAHVSKVRPQTCAVPRRRAFGGQGMDWLECAGTEMCTTVKLHYSAIDKGFRFCDTHVLHRSDPSPRQLYGGVNGGDSTNSEEAVLTPLAVRLNRSPTW